MDNGGPRLRCDRKSSGSLADLGIGLWPDLCSPIGVLERGTDSTPTYSEFRRQLNLVPSIRQFMEHDNIIDFAVIGGGVAGTYAAHRITTSPPSMIRKIAGKTLATPTVHLFELTPRIGGRLLSAPVPGMNFRAELGGMRFTSNHHLLRNVVRLLSLPEIEFRYDTKFMYLRGEHVRQVGGPSWCKSAPPYRDLSNDAVDQVLLKGIRLALQSVELPECGPEFSTADNKSIQSAREKLGSIGGDPVEYGLLSRREWMAVKRHGIVKGSNGRHLYELGLWNVLQHYLDSEEFLYLHDALGYESIFANWNAAEALPWFLADFGVNYLTLATGLDSVPLALARAVRTGGKERGVSTGITQGWELLSIRSVSHSGEQVMNLEFSEGGGWKGGTPSPRHHSVLARNVILALPKGALKRIKYFDIPRATEFPKLLRTVTPHPLFKLILGYKSAWWRDSKYLGASTGKVITDLPIRQVYYFDHTGNSSNGKKSARVKKSGPAAVMASYSDEHYVDFWRPLLHLPRGAPRHFDGDPENELSEVEKNVLDALGIGEPLAMKAHGQITKLYPEGVRDTIPAPYVGLVMDWMQAPYFGGWHTWDVHCLPTDVIQRMAQPFGDAKIFVCGEAFSSEQGWIEGALKSVELCLAKIGFAPPPNLELPDSLTMEEYSVT